MLKKHYLSLFFLITSIFFVTYEPSICKSSTKTNKLNPANVVIVWDYHDVLVKRNIVTMAKQFFSIIKKDLKLLGFIFWPPFWKELYELYKIRNKYVTIEKILEEIIKKHPELKPHWQEFLELINMCQPIEGSVEILKSLEVGHYQNYLASNIGNDSYMIQQKKFPYIFKYFQGCYIPIKKDEKTGFLIGKPSEEYYQELRDYLSKQKNLQDKTIIFIDDKKKNIEGAHVSNKNGTTNIIGIIFTSPEQLKTDLNNLIEMKEQIINENT